MNEYDSARIAESLEARGYEPTQDPKKADVVVVNTCSVRAKADQKMASLLGRLTNSLRHRPDAKLVVMGCVAQLQGASLAHRFSRLDLVLGADQVGAFGPWLDRGGPRTVQVDRVPRDRFEFVGAAPKRAVPVSAPVTVMKGCDNRCAYCVVPAARGPQVDRPKEDILAEVDRLVAAGAKEVLLIGQNVNAYRAAEGGFAKLLLEVADRPGVERVRFTTSHPRDLDLATVEAVASHPKLCSHFHLPVQSGSNPVLRRMGRGYSREKYLEKIGWIRKLVPGAAVSADVIVGFPGETEEDFEQTLSLMNEVGYTFLYSFKYSPRPNTRAWDMDDDVSEEAKAERLARLQALQGEWTQRNLDSWVGRKVPVLVEGISRRGDQAMGRTETFEVVNFATDGKGAIQELVGLVVPVEITRAGFHSLEGRVADSSSDKTTSMPLAQ